MSINTSAQTLIEGIWMHGHSCGCSNERYYKDAPMRERMQIAGKDLNAHKETWIKRMEEYAALHKNGLRWVKASERLPESKKWLFIDMILILWI